MEIVLTKEADKALNKIKDYTVLNRIKKGIAGLSELKGDIKKLQGNNILYRLRVGDYRILFQIENEQIIIVTTILPRGSVYKNL